MSSISQFLGGAPKRILRGATFVRSFAENANSISTGIFVDPQKSYIVSSYTGEASVYLNTNGGGFFYGVSMDGSGSAYISTSGEVVVVSGKGKSRLGYGLAGSSGSMNSAATVYWQVVEY